MGKLLRTKSVVKHKLIYKDEWCNNYYKFYHTSCQPVHNIKSYKIWYILKYIDKILNYLNFWLWSWSCMSIKDIDKSLKPKLINKKAKLCDVYGMKLERKSKRCTWADRRYWMSEVRGNPKRSGKLWPLGSER